MYGWPWHWLPGTVPARAAMMTLIALAVVAVLCYAVFTWASIHLPVDSSGFSG